MNILLPGIAIGSTGLVFVLSFLFGKLLVLERLRPGEKAFRYGRRIVYSLVLLWAYALFWHVTYTYPTIELSVKAYMRYCGLTALFLLFVVLTPGLFVSYFHRLSINGFLVHIRRALGVSVFFFSFLHGTVGFFYNLSANIGSISFLSERHQLALVFSGTAFTILLLLTLTSFDRMVSWLGNPRWKFLHRFVYVAAILSIFHAFLIGSHFTNANSALPLFVNGLTLTFILLEAGATIVRTRALGKNLGIFQAVCLLLLVTGGFYFSNKGLTSSYDPHARHRKGYSKDYTMSVQITPPELRPNEPTTLKLSITDKRTNKLLTKYIPSHEKLMHLMIIRRDLAYYDHIHPEHDGAGNFVITTTLPTPGTYTLFAEYSPPDFAENLSVATLQVGDTSDEKPASLSVGEFTKEFANRYKVALFPTGPFKVNDQVDFVFTLEEAGKPVDDLEPYLAAFGHMAAVSEDLATYTHVHPLGTPLSPQDRGGPAVQFSTFFPKTGKYKLFTQFKHEGNIFLTEFVVEVK